MLKSSIRTVASPTIDILVPVWNNLFETRACLVRILSQSAGARLIIVDYGSSRETELMLEEFSESLGDHGLFIKSERNIGLVAAINLGLARSDSDYCVIVCPNVSVQPGWLEVLASEAESTGSGIVTPQFDGAGAPASPRLGSGCPAMESFAISFMALLIRNEMRMIAGSFNEHLDGDEWCLKEYIRRVASYGYRTSVTSRLRLPCASGQTFGSAQRRNEMKQRSKSEYIARWGIHRHYCIYFGPHADAGSLGDTVSDILDGARQGHHFTLMLYRRQYSTFRKMGWNCLHTSIELRQISILFPVRDLQRKIKTLRTTSPDLLAVRGSSDVEFPDGSASILLGELLSSIHYRSTNSTGHPKEDLS